MKYLLLAALAMVATGCANLAQLDQGLYNVTNTVAGRDTVTGARTLSLSGRQSMITSQNAEMDAYFAEIESKGGKLNAALDAAAYARLQTITARLLKVSHFAAEQPQWKVFLLPDDTFNAFVNGGSYIMVNKGLMDQVKSDDEVAAVLGHEIAHNSANHIGESGTYQKVAILSGSNSAKRDTFQKSFSMENEREADRIGILYAALAGYDPFAASRVWERMYASNGNQVAISGHPLNRNRIAETKATAEKVQQYYTAGKVNPNAQALLANNVLWQQRGDVVQAGSGGGLAALAETAFTSYTQREQAKQVEKTQQQHAAQMQAVGSQLKANGANVVNANTVQVQFTYTGPQSLKVLAVAAILGNTRSVAHAQPPIVPGQPFALTFTGPNFGTQAQSLRFAVDDTSY